MTFRVKKTGNLTQAVYLKIYGTKAELDGGDSTKYDIFSQPGTAASINTGTARPLLSLRCKENIVNADGNSKTNIMRVVPLMLNFSSQFRAKFSLIKNPTALTVGGSSIDPTTDTANFTSSAQLSAIEYNTTATALSGGETVATFFSGDDDGQNLMLEEIFRYNREFLTRPISNDAGSAGDILTLVAESVADNSNTVNGSITWGER